MLSNGDILTSFISLEPVSYFVFLSCDRSNQVLPLVQRLPEPWLTFTACLRSWSTVRPPGGMFDESLVFVSYLRILGMLWCWSWAPWTYRLIGLLEKHRGALICGDTSYTSLQRRRTAPAAATVQAPEELNDDRGSVPRQDAVRTMLYINVKSFQVWVRLSVRSLEVQLDQVDAGTGVEYMTVIVRICIGFENCLWE